MGRKLAASLALLAVLAVLAGCGGRVTVASIRNEPWDQALIPSGSPVVPADWAEGTVTDVAPDGLTIKVKLERGEAHTGDRVSIFLKKPEMDPGAHYLDSENRGTRAAGGKVTAVAGDTVDATILDVTRKTPIEPGDPVVIRYP